MALGVFGVGGFWHGRFLALEVFGIGRFLALAFFCVDKLYYVSFCMFFVLRISVARFL